VTVSERPLNNFGSVWGIVCECRRSAHGCGRDANTFWDERVEDGDSCQASRARSLAQWPLVLPHGIRGARRPSRSATKTGWRKECSCVSAEFDGGDRVEKTQDGFRWFRARRRNGASGSCQFLSLASQIPSAFSRQIRCNVPDDRSFCLIAGPPASEPKGRARCEFGPARRPVYCLGIRNLQNCRVARYRKRISGCTCSRFFVFEHEPR